ncbi:LAMI_0A05402g1_1 [Lachancea mirantina]|uniref:Lysophospholipase n=1 Tax=Lachancea mirantina TaxID=1230905 RepID=A0A1G4IPP9_9SACH|nr:LAMI_0A05402g1_1 [Lachancea mirantina]
MYVCLLFWTLISSLGIIVPCSAIALASGTCPNEKLVRDAKEGLSFEEMAYMEKRMKAIQPFWSRFLEGFVEETGILNTNITSKWQQQPPRIGIAMSGGGYRSMLTTSGVLLKMQEYMLSDFLAYMSGTSGGSWAMTNLVLTDFNYSCLTNWNLEMSLLKGVPDIDIRERDVVSHLDLKGFEESLLLDDKFQLELKNSRRQLKRSDESMRDCIALDDELEICISSGLQSSNDIQRRGLSPILRMKEFLASWFDVGRKNNNSTASYASKIREVRELMEFYTSLHSEAKMKKLRGFTISFTDYWGIALLKMIAPTKCNQNDLRSLSDVMDVSNKFQSGEAPIPIFVANCKNDNLQNAVFEITPFEFGSWHTLKLFARTRYLGSELLNGVSRRCTRGFDELGFITATASSMFNNAFMYLWIKFASTQSTKQVMNAIFGAFSINLQFDKLTRRPHPEYALYPNPFYRHPTNNSSLTHEPQLFLADGGEDGENIPLRPLLVRQRQLDLIFAVDSSSDKLNLPDGSMLRNLYLHTRAETNHLLHPMPEIPPPEIFQTKGFLRKPVVFGCYLESYLGDLESANELPPMVAYFANTNHTYASNTSTFKLKYSTFEVQKMLQNGANVFGSNNDPEFKSCLDCFIVKRSFDRASLSQTGNQIHKIPPVCSACYAKYCYN